MQGQSPSKFWNFRNISAAETELLLYGYIADDAWWGDEVSPKMFLDDLAKAGDVSQITLRINSYGGSVFAGHAMHSILKSHKARVVVRIDGIAASAASVVAMAGDQIIMPSNAMMMIHNPLTYAVGDADEMRKVADTLDSVRDSIVAAYRDRTGLGEDKLRDLMSAETWMTAAEAVELGFADEVEQAVRVAASIGGGALMINGTRFDLSRINSIPAALFASEEVKDLNEPRNQSEEAQAVETEGALAEEQQAVTATEEEAAATATAQEEQATAVETPAAEAEGSADEAQPATETTETEDTVQNAILAERRRIADVQALSRPGAEAVIAAAIEDGSSAEQTALRVLNSPDVRNADLLARRRGDAAAVGGIDPATNLGTEGKESGFLASFTAAAKSLIQSRGKGAPKE